MKSYYNTFRKALQILQDPVETDEHKRQVRNELLRIASHIDIIRSEPPQFSDPDRLETVVDQEQTFYMY